MLKTTEVRKLTKRVQEKLAGCPEIRPFPEAVTRLLAACQDENSTAATFEKIIECDPALAGKLLRMANSPLYGLSNEVGSVGHATSVLGIRQLKNLALSVAGRAMFAKGHAALKERQLVWHHSIGCATVARLLSKSASGVASDDAFLAGIFHDVGKLFFFDVVPDEYQDLRVDYDREQLTEGERLVFGSSHEEIGLQSGHSWGLPEDIKVAIGFHHRPNASPIHSEMVAVVHTANRLASSWGLGSEADPAIELSDEIVERFALDEASLELLEGQAREMFEDAVQALS